MMLQRLLGSLLLLVGWSWSLAFGQSELINANLVVAGHINMCQTGPTGGTDTYACTLDRTITALTTKACYGFVADVANTGAASINYSSLGAKTIKKVQGGITTDLADNDIRAGQIVHTCYDGTNMQCQNCTGNAPGGTPGGSSGQAQYNNGGVLGGTSGLSVDGTQVLSLAPRITSASATATLGTNDGPIVACTGGASDITLTLPPGATTTQRKWAIIKIDTGAGKCLVKGNGTETINGSTGTLEAATRWSRVDLDLAQTTGTPNWSGVSGKTQLDFNTDITGFKRYVTLEVVPDATALTTGDGKAYFPIHADLNGWTVVGVSAYVGAAVSSSGVVNVDIDVCGVVATGVRCSGTNRDLLSTNLTIDANEDSSVTAATPAVINTANDDLATDEWLRVNIDATGTGTQGLYVTVVLQKP